MSEEPKQNQNQSQNTQQQEDKQEPKQQVQLPDNKQGKTRKNEEEIPKTYQSIINQQKEQIDALMQQNDLLNAQITKMVQNGTQLNDNNSTPKPPDTPTSLSEDYVSLSDLGKEIGTNR